MDDTEKALQAYEKLRAYLYEFGEYAYNESTEIITKGKSYIKDGITENEKPLMIILNKNMYQYYWVALDLIDKNFLAAAALIIRGFLEGVRLIRALCLDGNFRREYLINDNLEYHTVRDDAFTQKRVIKSLNDMYELAKKEQEEKGFYGGFYLECKCFLKGEMYSRIHSVLSKIAHLTNINILNLMNTEKNKIYLGVENKGYDDLYLKLNLYEYLVLLTNEHYTFIHGYYSTGKCNSYGDKYTEMWKMLIEILYKK